MLLGPLFYAVIIVLMFMIIHSLRRSIREERTLDRRNVWYLRSIGLLTIAAELIGSAVDWVMSRRAASCSPETAMPWTRDSTSPIPWSSWGF